jgi:hypothetical protein
VNFFYRLKIVFVVKVFILVLFFELIAVHKSCSQANTARFLQFRGYRVFQQELL